MFRDIFSKELYINHWPVRGKFSRFLRDFFGEFSSIFGVSVSEICVTDQ